MISGGKNNLKRRILLFPRFLCFITNGNEKCVGDGPVATCDKAHREYMCCFSFLFPNICMEKCAQWDGPVVNRSRIGDIYYSSFLLEVEISSGIISSGIFGRRSGIAGVLLLIRIMKYSKAIFAMKMRFRLRTLKSFHKYN